MVFGGKDLVRHFNKVMIRKGRVDQYGCLLAYMLGTLVSFEHCTSYSSNNQKRQVIKRGGVFRADDSHNRAFRC